MFVIQQSWPLLFYDSVIAYARAMHELLEEDGHALNVSSQICTQIPAQPWSMGEHVMKYLRKVRNNPVLLVIHLTM